MTQTVAFKTIMEALLDTSKPFPPRYLHRFSDITPQDLKSLLAAWPKVSEGRKQSLLEDLEDLAETDTLMSFEDLARALLKDVQPQVRLLAIRLLWECEDPKLAPVFMEILGGDEEGAVRAGAATALGLFVYLGEVEQIPPALHHQVEDQLLKAAESDKEILVRRRAVEALGTSSRAEVPPLIEAAYARKEAEWVVSALFAMGRSADDRWEKQILSNLLNANEEIRIEAIRAAGELGLKAARTILLDSLGDEEDLEMRRELIWALSKVGGEGVRGQLEEMLDAEPDDEEADFLQEALDNLAFNEDMGLFDMFDFQPDDEDQ